MRNNELLPYDTIVQATSGEPEAVNTVLPIMPDISAITPTFTGITTWIWRTTSRRN